MSNTNVGQVYSQIINDVIEAVRVDFEEGGVDDAVLGELTKGWQRKLTQMNVASFPWEPKPEPMQAPPPAAAAAPPPHVPSAAYTQATLSPPPNALSLPGGSSNGTQVKAEPSFAKSEPGIKQEPGMANGVSVQGYPASNAPRPMPGQGMAAQRAAQALESQYGQRAAASINAIHSGMQASQLPPGQPRPGQPQHALNPHQQYQRSVSAAMAAQQQQRNPQAPHLNLQNGQNGLPTSQMDGPSGEGYEGILMQRGADGGPVEMGRVEIDNLLHDKIAARAKQMEGGGLMLPLKEATRHRSIASKKRSAGGPSQVDGDDDDEDLDDADAINSDLDDPEDDQEEDDDEDDPAGQMMLCMYDKVQRVKNKWKCTLKDGVLTVNGREYVFHKATGEYEW